MSILAKPTRALKPKTKESQQMAIILAAILVVMAVAQLYTFDTFILLVPSFNLPLAGALPYVIAPLIVAAEVFALPFLLRMYLSPAFRWVSMFFGWLTALLWIFITIWVVGSSQPVENIGFLGTVTDLVPGWWALCVSVGLGILSAWASWGLWPPAISLHNTKK